MKVNPYGILGQKAPELAVEYFVNKDGQKVDAPTLAKTAGSVRIIFCFQSGCPSCHRKGFPTLQEISKRFATQIENGALAVIPIQTAFEGRSHNSADTLTDMQAKYDIDLPFGHDDAHPRPKTMTAYRTGGTPWYIIVDQNDKVIFNDFHFDGENTYSLIEKALKNEHTVPEGFAHTVTDHPEQGRYTIKLDANNDAIVIYRKEGDVLFLDHTEVPVALRGQGYGAVMMEAVLEKIESQGYKIKPICSYARHHATRYQRWAHLL